MPLVINEVVSDITIVGGASGSPQPVGGDPGPDLDRALRLVERLRAEAGRLTGRDEDDRGAARP
jgi:hypothetical protein